jgi:dsDNA-specific endonuclease/ATPase MutS2
MFYNKSIDYVLSEFSSRLIGVQVIAEQVNYHSRDVFDELARGYWRDMKEMSA